MSDSQGNPTCPKCGKEAVPNTSGALSNATFEGYQVWRCKTCRTGCDWDPDCNRPVEFFVTSNGTKHGLTCGAGEHA